MDPLELPVNRPRRAAPGLLIQRRHFLTLAANLVTGALALAAGRPARARQERLATDRVSLEEFLVEVAPRARELLADTSRAGQDRYLRTVAAFAAHLGDVPRPDLRPSGQGPGASIGVHPGGDPFTALHWELEPGGIIHPHAHTYGNVVTVGLAGACAVANYETVDPPRYDATEAFEVRCTRVQWLTAGGVNLVSLERDWCHGFRAGPRGAAGLDLTTRLGERRPTPWLRPQEPARSGAGDVFEARWAHESPGG